MTTYDPFQFVFDKTVRDISNGVRIDVTVVDPEANILITLKSGELSIPFFLKDYYARLLAQFLLQACDAQAAAAAAIPKTSETEDD